MAHEEINVSVRPFHPTDLATWQACPHRFDILRMRGEKPSWRHVAALNGTAIHSVVRKIHERALWAAEDEKEIKRLYLSEFQRAIDEPRFPSEANVPVWWGDGRGIEDAILEFGGDAICMLEGYRNDPRNQSARILLCEQTWTATLAGEPWEGTPDQIRFICPGHVEIVDLKTDAKRIHPTSLMMWPQGLTYALGIEIGTFTSPEPDTHLDVQVDRMTWLHLRDYVPYQRRGKRSDGTPYLAGDLRGDAFYSVNVTRQMLESHQREMELFALAVRDDRFERRPAGGPLSCAMCKVSDRCLSSFTGIVKIDPSLAIIESEE